MNIGIFRSRDTVDLPATDARHIRLVGGGARLNWSGGGLVWHTPLWVEVRQQEKVRRLPIVNMTLLLSVGIWLVARVLVGMWKAKQAA